MLYSQESCLFPLTSNKNPLCFCKHPQVTYWQAFSQVPTSMTWQTPLRPWQTPLIVWQTPIRPWQTPLRPRQTPLIVWQTPLSHVHPSDSQAPPSPLMHPVLCRATPFCSSTPPQSHAPQVLLAAPPVSCTPKCYPSTESSETIIGRDMGFH